MTVKELYDKIKRIQNKEDVNIYFCPQREMEETEDEDWRWKDCVKVEDTDLERIYVNDGWENKVERNLILLPEEE